MDDDFKVHDVTISDQVRLQGGKALNVTHLQFYVGSHGPFQVDFQKPNNTPAQLQAYIQQRVTDLRSITERQY